MPDSIIEADDATDVRLPTTIAELAAVVEQHRPGEPAEALTWVLDLIQQCVAKPVPLAQRLDASQRFCYACANYLKPAHKEPCSTCLRDPKALEQFVPVSGFGGAGY